MSQRPPLQHQPPSTSPPSFPRPPSTLARPFSYTPVYAAPLVSSSTNGASSVGRRGSIGGSYTPAGSFRRDSSGASPTSYYSTPVGQPPTASYHYTHAAPPPAQSALGRPAPTARRLSFASSPPHPHPPHNRPASTQLPSPPVVKPQHAAPLSSARRPSIDMQLEPNPLSSRRPKTPPDCCAVCGVTETPEWRKGPAGNRSLCNSDGLVAARRAKERAEKGFAQPSTIEEIERELEGIGADRFKSPNGRFTLPAGTHQRILVTQERTRKQQQQQQIATTTRARSRSKLAGQDTREAASSLLGLRRASVDAQTPHHSYASAMAPRSPPSSSRVRRSGSLVGQNAQFASNVGGEFGLPCSASYMHTSGISSASSARPSSIYVARPPSPSSSNRLPPLNPDALRAPTPVHPSGLVRPASPSLSHPISALTNSTNRMSIAHLTSERPASPAATFSRAVPGAPPTPVSVVATSALRRRSASVGRSQSRSSSVPRTASS